MTSYRFAGRYVEGKTVLDIATDGSGYGSHLLAETAERVESLLGSAEARELASTMYPALNVSYQEVQLPKLPYENEHFDVAIAYEVVEELEHPEDLVVEVKRVLKPGGTFLISTPDKHTYSNERNHKDPSHKREMYVPEFRGMLERHFEHVRIYRQGAVAGGFIFEDGEQSSTVLLESVAFSSTNPSFGTEPPKTRFVMAVCGDSEFTEQENQQPYLLLDREQRIFDEYDDGREDVELLRGEIEHLQETEVQAFRDTLGYLRSDLKYLEAQLKRSQAQIKAQEQSEAQIRSLQAHIRAMESSAIWRLSAPYRLLRTRVGSLVRNAKRV